MDNELVKTIERSVGTTSGVGILLQWIPGRCQQEAN